MIQAPRICIPERRIFVMLHSCIEDHDFEHSIWLVGDAYHRVTFGHRVLHYTNIEFYLSHFSITKWNMYYTKFHKLYIWINNYSIRSIMRSQASRNEYKNLRVHIIFDDIKWGSFVYIDVLDFYTSLSQKKMAE